MYWLAFQISNDKYCTLRDMLLIEIHDPYKYNSGLIFSAKKQFI